MKVSVYNNTGVVIAATQVVRQTGTRLPEQIPTIALASAAVSTTAVPMGITVAAIADSSVGHVVIAGPYFPIDTSAFAVNADVFLSDTPGAISTSAGTVEALVGTVTTVDTAGTINVLCQSTTSFTLSP